MMIGNTERYTQESIRSITGQGKNTASVIDHRLSKNDGHQNHHRSSFQKVSIGYGDDDVSSSCTPSLDGTNASFPSNVYAKPLTEPPLIKTTRIEHQRQQGERSESSQSRINLGSSSSHSHLDVLTEALIIDHLNGYYEGLNANRNYKMPEIWRTFCQQYQSSDYVLMRASGNPLSQEGFVQMHCNQDCQNLKMVLVSVDHIQLIAGGKIAVVNYTADQCFRYKGTLNEDRCCVTCIIELTSPDNTIRIRHEHRTKGIPTPEKTRWK